MGASVFFAIRDAVKNSSKAKILQFDSPATVERIRMACDDIFSEKVLKTANTILNFLARIFEFTNDRTMCYMIPNSVL